MTKFLIPLGVFVAIVVFLGVGLGQDPRLVPSPLVGKKAPEFSLPSLKTPERILTRADLSGQAVLVNVWATWCVACRAEHEFLLQIARRGEVPIYGVNYKDERDQALLWLRQLGDPYVASVYDPEGRLALDLGVYGAPETFVLDADGVIAYKHIGPLDEGVWRQKIAPVLSRLQGVKG